MHGELISDNPMMFFRNYLHATRQIYHRDKIHFCQTFSASKCITKKNSFRKCSLSIFHQVIFNKSSFRNISHEASHRSVLLLKKSIQNKIWERSIESQFFRVSDGTKQLKLRRRKKSIFDSFPRPSKVIKPGVPPSDTLARDPIEIQELGKWN